MSSTLYREVSDPGDRLGGVIEVVKELRHRRYLWTARTLTGAGGELSNQEQGRETKDGDVYNKSHPSTLFVNAQSRYLPSHAAAVTTDALHIVLVCVRFKYCTMCTVRLTRVLTLSSHPAVHSLHLHPKAFTSAIAQASTHEVCLEDSTFFHLCPESQNS